MNKSIIQTPTPDLKKSITFYKDLQFEMFSRDDLVLVSDGSVVIEINPDRYSRTGIKIYKESWSDEIAKLKNHTNINYKNNTYTLCDPSGVWIYLEKGDPTDDFDVSGISPSILGNYVGVSIETADILRSFEIWNILGFEKTMGDLDKGWISCKNRDGMVISLMKSFSCPHLFFNPSLTYFNGKENLTIINKIRELNVTITEEITYFNKEGIVDNIIIRDPGGFGFFIFND